MGDLFFVQMTTVQNVVSLVSSHADGSPMTRDEAVDLLLLLQRNIHNTGFCVVLMTW